MSQISIRSSLESATWLPWKYGLVHKKNHLPTKKKQGPLTPFQHPYHSGFVKYINARLYSINNEVIRVTRSDLRPPNRSRLRCIDTHLGRLGLEQPHRAGAQILENPENSCKSMLNMLIHTRIYLGI